MIFDINKIKLRIIVFFIQTVFKLFVYFIKIRRFILDYHIMFSNINKNYKKFRIINTEKYEILNTIFEEYDLEVKMSKINVLLKSKNEILTQDIKSIKYL